MATGVVVIDMSTEPDLVEHEGRDRWALCVLDHCPDGAQVIVDIGTRDWVTNDAANWLHLHDHRLNIAIHGTNPIGVRRFMFAARTGRLEAA